MICAIEPQDVPMLSGEDSPISALIERLRLVMGNRRFLRAPLLWTAGVRQSVEQALSSNQPIRVLLLWGKGPKSTPDCAEERTAMLLRRYAEAMTSVWGHGLQYHILFADTHAQANGFPPDESDDYFQAVRGLLGEKLFCFGRLSHIWQEGGLDWYRVCKHASALEGPAWSECAIRLNLISAAARHSRLRDPDHAARMYFAIRVLENRILARSFDGSFYATSDAPDRILLCPDLPVLHMYSIARGRCAKPWFTMMSEAARAPEVTERCAA